MTYNGLTILQLNIGGINNTKKFDRIKIMLTKLNKKCDIIILGETKLKPKFPSGIYNLNGYNSIKCCRDSKNSGGGLLIFIKKDIVTYNIIKISTTFERIEFYAKFHNKSLRFLCYYRPPVNDSISLFFEDLESELQKSSCTTIILGDVNFDANCDTPDSQRYVTLLNSYDFKISNKL